MSLEQFDAYLILTETGDTERKRLSARIKLKELYQAATRAQPQEALVRTETGWEHRRAHPQPSAAQQDAEVWAVRRDEHDRWQITSKPQEDGLLKGWQQRPLHAGAMSIVGDAPLPSVERPQATSEKRGRCVACELGPADFPHAYDCSAVAARQPDADPQATSGEYPEPLANFGEGQWWINELDRMSKTDDQKRAVGVVHHLLASALAARPTWREGRDAAIKKLQALYSPDSLWAPFLDSVVAQIEALTPPEPQR